MKELSKSQVIDVFQMIEKDGLSNDEYVIFDVWENSTLSVYLSTDNVYTLEAGRYLAVFSEDYDFINIPNLFKYCKDLDSDLCDGVEITDGVVHIFCLEKIGS